jgi:hypothetical protein
MHNIAQHNINANAMIARRAYLSWLPKSESEGASQMFNM